MNVLVQRTDEDTGRLVRRTMLVECFVQDGKSYLGRESLRIEHCFKLQWTSLSALNAWVPFKHRYFALPASGRSVIMIAARMGMIGTG